ncbi:MAG: hypothetical protein ACE5IR_19025, partial [bacterium]
MGIENRIDPIDEALRILYLEQSVQDAEHVLFHDPLYRLDKLPVSITLSEGKKELLFNKLLQRVDTIPTLGYLLNKQIEKTNYDLVKLSDEIKFPLERLNKLLEDLVLPNSVPVRIMKKLLVGLNIPFELAEKAILNSFRVLRLKQSTEENLEKLIPASYRKTSASALSDMKLRTYSAGNRGLFENEDALRKYLNRLD